MVKWLWETTRVWEVLGQIPASYTWWIFFTLIYCKHCIVCLERPKINEKEARDGPFKKIFFQICQDSNISNFWRLLIRENAVPFRPNGMGGFCDCHVGRRGRRIHDHRRHAAQLDPAHHDRPEFQVLVRARSTLSGVLQSHLAVNLMKE